MTMDAPARRLLALLLEEQAIETEPIADVRADLAALGLDPVRAVAAARRMAAGAASPAVALLGRIAEAEASDDEIRRLEQADIASVRRSLEEGATVAAIAKAQRASGRASNVVGLRRRRSRRLLYGLCGVAAALAASLVLMVRIPSFFEETFSHGLPEQPAAPASTAGLQSATNETGNLQARMAPAANGSTQTSQQTVSLSAPPRASADAETTTRAKSEADEKDVLQAASQPASELADAPAQTAGSVSTGAAGQSNTEELRGDASANRIAEPFGLDRPIAALLIVDPKLVPADLKQENYPAGDLLARLGDARRLAGDRPIAALVTLRLADRTADAVVIAGAPAESEVLRRDLDKAAPVASPASPAAAGGGYDVILLDRR
jgi:hypothetical protein